MTISPSQTIPSITTKRLGAGGMEDFNLAEFLQNKKAIIFGVPGAYTPSCHEKHMPGYIQNADAIKAKGVDEIICITVNDPFVAAHWATESGADGKITVIPDGNADLTKAMGLDFDGSGAGLATRSKRYVMIVQNGVVETIDIEAAPSDVELSSAGACMLKL